MGVLLQRLPGHHLRGGLERPAEAGRGAPRTGPAAAAPRRGGARSAHPLPRQQDGPAGRSVLRQDRGRPGAGPHPGQAVAHLRLQCRDGRGAGGGRYLVHPAGAPGRPARESAQPRGPAGCRQVVRFLFNLTFCPIDFLFLTLFYFMDTLFHVNFILCS